MQKLTLVILFLSIFFNLTAQDTICVNPTIEHTIYSKHLKEHRNYWVALPLGYVDSLTYPVIYVFDAEWRFDLIKHMVFDLGANKKIQASIVIGIPHVDWEKKRGIDLTFSESRMEYDGDAVDSTWYNASNSGGALKFYQYLTQELIEDVNNKYSSNGHETLVGHSYGGYFGAYLLSLEHPFEVLHIYDPSIWYSDGEVTKRFNATDYKQKTRIHLTYQPEPKFHRKKIEKFIKSIKKCSVISLSTEFYKRDTHNSLFLDSFYQGILKTQE